MNSAEFTSEHHSVSHLIAQLKDGEQISIQQLWGLQRPIGKSRAPKTEWCAGRKLPMKKILAECFLSFYRGATAGRLENVLNRDDLWWLLIGITKQKTSNLIRYETALKRGGGKLVDEAAIQNNLQGNLGFDLELFASEQLSPDFIVALEDQGRFLLELLRDDQLRFIATARIEGYSVLEIADKLKITTRSIERKLQLIRNSWKKELIRATRTVNPA